MKEKIIKSPGEQGEYLLSEDTVDKRMLFGGEWTTMAVPCVSVFFKKDRMEDYESVKSFDTFENAEKFVASEIKRTSESSCGIIKA